jgi:hypothetical protein
LTNNFGPVVIRLINSDRISGLVKLKKKRVKFAYQITQAELLLELTFLIIVFHLPEVDIWVQNGKGVLGSLVPSILDMGLAC